MDIPNSTAGEFQSVERKTQNQQRVVREQIDVPQNRESSGLKSRPGREFRAYRLFRLQGKLRDPVRTNCRALLPFVKAVHSFRDYDCEH
jgi:hypothetical protein